MVAGALLPYMPSMLVGIYYMRAALQAEEKLSDDTIKIV